MTVLLCASQKGGSGKTTIAINIACELTRLGKTIVLVDADKQCSASRWGQDRNNSEYSDITIVCAYENIKKTVLDLNKKYEYVVVDVAGHDSSEFRSGLLAADILIAPFRPSQFDLDTLPFLSKLLVDTKMYNENIKAKAVLNMAPSNPQVNEAKEAKEYFFEFPEFELCKTIIRDRKAFRDSVSYGAGVVEWKDNKAKAEIQLLIQELI